MGDVSFSKVIITLSFILLILYTIAVLYIFATTGLEPETMTRYFVGAIIGEFGFLSGIKVTKLFKSKQTKEVQCDDEHDPHANS